MMNRLREKTHDLRVSSRSSGEHTLKRLRRSAIVHLSAILILFSVGTQAAPKHPLSDQPLARTPLTPKDRERLFGRLRRLTVTDRRCREFDACEDVFAALLAGSVQFIEPIMRAANPEDAAYKKLSRCFNLPLFHKETWISKGLDDKGRSVTYGHEAVAEGPIVVYSIKSFDELLLGDGFLVMLTGYRTRDGSRFEAPDIIKIVDNHLCIQIGNKRDIGSHLFDVGFFRYRARNYAYRIMKYPESVAVSIVPSMLGGGLALALFELR
jgi:hypothetical protein